MRSIRNGILRELKVARMTRKRSKSSAKFVAVTGSSTKSTTTQIISGLVEQLGPVQTQVYSNTINPILRRIKNLKPHHEHIVLEIGAGISGALGKIAAMVRPDLTVVTMIKMEHKSAYGSLEAIAQEKGQLLEHMMPDGVAVLNGDDPNTLAMARLARGRTVTFGQSDSVDYRASNIRFQWPQGLSLTITPPDGQAFDVTTKFIGTHFWLPVTAAVAAACELGVRPGQIQSAIAKVAPLDCRMMPVMAPDGRCLLLDTMKAPAHSLDLAFNVLNDFDAPYRRIVLGTVSDTKVKPKRQYRDAYRAAREVADQVVFVGEWADKSGASDEDIANGRFVAFKTMQEASAHLKQTAVADEVVLIKGSLNQHMERLAIDQTLGDVACWPVKCVSGENCYKCGYWGQNYDPKTRKLQLRWQAIKNRSKGLY